MTLRFKDTCFGKAQTWLSILNPYPNVYTPDDTMMQAEKDATLKSIFLQNWQLMDRTPDSIFMHFERIKFDPAKDNVEDFCNDMKNLAQRLSFPEVSWVSAIRNRLPPMLATQVMHINNFEEIK